jgi:starch synthase
MDQKKLKVLFVASEVSPFAKTGGLADVAGSLPRALVSQGHDIRIAMPKYKFIETPMETRFDFPVIIRNRKETAIIREHYIEVNDNDTVNRVPVYFVDNYHYFDRENLYCYFDEAERFAFFYRAVLEMLSGLDFKPDIIHCNDWQSGPIPALLKKNYDVIPFYRDIATIITIHNLHYQGNYPRECLESLGLPDSYFHPDKLEFYGDVSFLKAGIVYADLINTVSRTYAREIQTQEFGERMEGLMRSRAKDLYGIVNGINTSEFNPATDPYIAANYDSTSIEKKVENKHSLQKSLHLPVSDSLMIGLVSRLVDQKGLDLIQKFFMDFIGEDIQFIVLGQGDELYEQFFKEMSRKYPEKMAVHIGFNNALAQRIYAACDLFLMPSKFEPCGLGQLIGLRYGTLPIVRATGGLADTVEDYSPVSGTGNGFVFTEYSAAGLLNAIKRALKLYRDNAGVWRKMVKTALESDFSWKAPAQEYIKLYRLALEKKSGENGAE